MKFVLVSENCSYFYTCIFKTFSMSIFGENDSFTNMFYCMLDVFSFILGRNCLAFELLSYRVQYHRKSETTRMKQ